MRAWPPAWAHLQPNCKFIASYMEMIKSVYPTICYIAAVCMVAAMTACTSSPGGETDPELNEYPIAFQAPQMETRSAVNNELEMSDFRIWGWRTSENEPLVPVFEGEKVSAGSWTYEGGTRYWVMDQTYNFYAVHPVFPLEGNETTVNVTSDGTFTINNFDCSKTGDEAVDLMTASAKGLIYKTGETPQKVGLTFQHELAKVTITVISESSVVTITNCKIFGVRYKGTFIRNSIGTTPWQGFSVNAQEDDFFKAEEFSLNNDGENTLVRNVFGEMLLLPHTDDMLSEVKLLFSYHYGDEITDRESTIDLQNEAVKSWEPGKSYDYTITIRSTDLSVAVKIMDWQETNTSVEWN